MFAIAVMATPASAQDKSVVIMRKALTGLKKGTPPPVGTPSGQTPAPTPTPAPQGYYSWMTTAWKDGAGQCGDQAPATRDVTCVRTDGAVVADAFCTGNGSGEKPETSQIRTISTGCGYAWSTGEWSVPALSCGTSPVDRAVTCMRGDGTVAADDKCAAVPKPAGRIDRETTTGCSYFWNVSQWSRENCGAETETRQVFCQRSDGKHADDTLCGSPKPATSEQATAASACGYSWELGAMGSPQPACGDTVVVQSVTCKREDGQLADESMCTLGTKPKNVFPSKDYSACIYGWSTGDWGAPSTTCGQATSSRDVTCTNQNGVAADPSLCLQQRPDATRSSHEISGCSVTWSTGEWSGAMASCGVTFRTRSVTCRYSDGTVAPLAACSGAGAMPSETDQVTDFSKCQYSWATDPWGDWSTQCGTATQTRGVRCQRSDGATVPDAQCSSIRPQDTQSAYQVAGCGYSWQTGAWGSVAPGCGATTQTRSVTCLRDDGQTVSDDQCSMVGDKPSTTQAALDYSTCSYDWATGQYEGAQVTCGTQTLNRRVYCQRSDGTEASFTLCSGTRPASTETSMQTAGCTYAWTPDPWVPVPGCGTVPASRTISCTRSDGTKVDPGMCANSGPKPAMDGTTQDFSACSYSWYAGLWTGKAQCGQTVTQTREVYCLRQDGTKAGDPSCAGVGTRPASTQPITDYSACNYSWTQVKGTWDATCSATATRTNVTSCTRGDGVVVAPDLCDPARRPADVDTGNFAGCTYDGTYSPVSACTGPVGPGAGSQTVALSSCRRSDGTLVATTNCSPASKTAACTVSTSSTQFAREAGALLDPYSYAPASVGRYQNPGSSPTLNLVVTTTLCWDYVNNKSVAGSSCSALTSGPNVYDIMGVPATYVPSLREVYVNQADLLTAQPHGNNFLANTLATICSPTSTVSVQVGTSAGLTPYVIRCGTPDAASNYQRSAGGLYDPSVNGTASTKYANPSSAASALNFVVLGTQCWNLATGASAPSAKCSYLPSGPSTYDLVSVPASFVPDLREVYVNRVDLAATEPHADSFLGTSLANLCGGTTAYYMMVGPSTGQVSYRVRCGVPDAASSYQRSVGGLQDPSTYAPASLKYVNSTSSATSLNLVVIGTQCWNTATNAAATDATKCSYLPSGPVYYDIVNVPATFVPDLREIYVNRADLAATEPHADSFFGVSLTTFCSASAPYTVMVGTSAGQVTYKVRCGTPDSPSNYQRLASGLNDPSVYYNNQTARYSNGSAAATSLYLAVSSTQCWNVSTGAVSTDASKCANLPAGPVVYDQMSVPATFVQDLHEVYVDRANLAALEPHADWFYNATLANFCSTASTASVMVGPSTGQTAYRIRCGTPDSPDHYRRVPTALADPYAVLGATKGAVNGTSVPQLSMAVNGTSCYDTAISGTAATGKCDYLPTGPRSGDVMSLAATWDTIGKTVTISAADLRASLPYTPATGYVSSTTVCGASYTVKNGVAGTYKVVCQ